MGLIISGMITSFTIEEDKNFRVNITRKDVEGTTTTPDITLDTVTVYIYKDIDSTPEIIKNADVATYGATGGALFTLLNTETDISDGRYTAQVWWYLAGGTQYKVYDGKLTVDKKALTS